MKRPRTADFDPNAKKHALKSSLEHMPTIEKPPAASLATTAHQESTPPQGRQIALRTAPNTKHVKRKVKTRHPFDIYEDQLDSLKRLAFEEKMQGDVGSMSAMVRDALDAYLNKKMNV